MEFEELKKSTNPEPVSSVYTKLRNVLFHFHSASLNCIIKFD